MLKSSELINLEAELLAIGKGVESPLILTGIFGDSCRQHSPNIILEVDPKLYIDVEWKKSLIEALATLHFANLQSNKTSEQILESISGVPQVCNNFHCLFLYYFLHFD